MENNAIQVFKYKEQQVRTTEIEGEIWFVAKDVCDILGYVNVSKTIDDHLDVDEKGITKCETPGGMQDMTIVSEPGLYALVLRSNKPEAKQFSRWVRHEVLPSIRKTGNYSVKVDSTDLEIRYKELETKNRELDLRGAELLQHMIDSPSYPITDESKAILAHEATKLITGHENRAMLPLVKEAMYSASEIGARFNVSKNKIGKVANAHGLKPPICETNEYGTWIRTKSKYSAHECPQFMYNDNALDWFREHQELLA